MYNIKVKNRKHGFQDWQLGFGGNNMLILLLHMTMGVGRGGGGLSGANFIRFLYEVD